MLKKRIFTLIIVFIGIICSWYWYDHKSQAEQKQTQSLYYYTHISEFSMMNEDILNMVVASYGATYFGVKELDEQIYNTDLRLQGLIEQMDNMAVSKPFQQAHEDLKRAYQEFQKVLATYKKNMKKDGMLTVSNAKMLDSASVPITEASDEWYAIYKKTMEKKEIHGPLKVLGTVQNQQFYIQNTQDRMVIIIGDFESNLLKWVEMKNNDGYDAITKLVLQSPGRKVDLQKFISYMKIVKVPETYSSVHQQLLNAYENYYNTINHGIETDVVDEKYSDELKGCFLDMKKASEQWQTVLQEQGDAQ